MHELLYQVFLKYDFIPEAFTHKFDIHWGQNPLRPEFAESTYLLYKATEDPYYLKVVWMSKNFDFNDDFFETPVIWELCFRSGKTSLIESNNMHEFLAAILELKM